MTVTILLFIFVLSRFFRKNIVSWHYAWYNWNVSNIIVSDALLFWWRGLPRIYDCEVRFHMISKEDETQYRLVAPDVDALLDYFDHRSLNPNPSTPALLAAFHSISEILSPLAPLKANDEAKAILQTLRNATKYPPPSSAFLNYFHYLCSRIYNH